MTLDELIKTVAIRRQDFATKKTSLTEKRQAWEREHQLESDELDMASFVLESAEFELKKATLQATEEEVKATGGLVKIRNVKSLSYDESDAIEWAADQKQYGVLSIKKRDFEKAARDLIGMENINLPPGMAPSFVTVIPERQATIAKDLSKVLNDDSS
jgi:hypothetical protein